MATLEERKQTLRDSRMCRFCLYKGETLTSIYEKLPASSGHSQIPLPLQIMACVSIEVFPTDGMPKTICSICRFFMDQSYRFKQICKQADEALRHYSSSGDMHDPIPWPIDLIKHLPTSITQRSEEKHIILKSPAQKAIDKKKVLQTKLQIPKKRLSTPIKVEEPPTKIKVVHDGDTLLFSQEDFDENDDDENVTTIELNTMEAATATTTSVQNNTFPCEHCDRSYPLQQLLDIHMQQHLKERLHKCKICERSYFTKYDLQKHMLIHSGLKPFSCVICQKAFVKLNMLRRHEKTHVNVPRMKCEECEQSFLSGEELTAHIDRKHSLARPFKCSDCPKRFAFKQGLERHFIVHSQEKPFKCNYCPESFVSNIKLMKHIQGHAGNRPYPCKFCPKSFLLSHHYTRHLRSKHMRPADYVDKDKTQTHKCLQCNSVFEKQDELIFHSAVHATEDLICPLCKEKFEDVESVTAHVKAHISVKEEYVCEWCELIFMCEEKLNNHIDMEHGDNLIGDPHEEISYLENKLVDDDNLVYEEEEPEEEDEDEEDEYYDTSIQEDNGVVEEGNIKKGTIIVDDKTYKFNIAEMEIDFLDGQTAAQKENKINSVADNDGAGLTEMKTVQPALAKSSPASSKNTMSTPKLSILQKAAMVNQQKLSQQSGLSKEDMNLLSLAMIKPIQPLTPVVAPVIKAVTKPSPPVVNKVQAKVISPASQEKKAAPPSPVTPRTNEKSLILLEQDLEELKKGADSNQQRFPSFRESFPKKSLTQTTLNYYKKSPEDKNKSNILKHTTPEKKIPQEKPVEMKKPTPVLSAKKTFLKRNDEAKMSTDDEEEEEDDLDFTEDYNPSSPPRRSGRPSKVKDYAAMIRDNTRVDDSDEDKLSDLSSESESDEEEYTINSIPSFETKKKPAAPAVPGKRGRGRPRKIPITDETALDATPVTPPVKTPGKKRGRPPKNAADTHPASENSENKDTNSNEATISKPKAMKGDDATPKKRGRPRKVPQCEEPYKPAIIKTERSSLSFPLKSPMTKVENKPFRYKDSTNSNIYNLQPTALARVDNLIQAEVLKTPTGQTLKKVSASVVRSLTKDVKVLPLPPKVTEMKVGPNKVVKVQRVLMTKAEVEEMAKKGLVEFKDGAMVLKPGVKLPVAENKPSSSAPSQPSPVPVDESSQSAKTENEESAADTEEEQIPDEAKDVKMVETSE